MTSPIGDYLPYLKEGKLRLLATSGETRSRFAPDVPTYAEQGFKSLVMSEYYEVFLPGKVSPELVRRAADAVKAAVASPDVIEAFAKLGLEAMPASAKVGTSGNNGERAAAVVASARIFPLLICGAASAVVMKPPCTSPVTSAVTASPVAR